MTASTTDPLRRLSIAWWPIVALVLLVAISYSNAVTPTFVWDDHQLIEMNPLVRSNASLLKPFFVPFFPETVANYGRGYYRPLTLLSLFVEYRLRGNEPAGFHATNVCLHLVNVLLLYFVCRRGGASRPASFFASAAWALAPRLTESVSWISGRTDLLGGLGTFAALLAFLSPSPFVRAAAPLFFGAGLLGKEVAVALLVAVVFYCRPVPVRTEGKRTLEVLLPYLAVLTAWLVLRSTAISGRTVPSFVEGKDRLLTIVEAIGWYPVMIVDAFRPRTQIGMVALPNRAVLIVGIVTLVAAAFLARRLFAARPGVRAGIGLAIGGLLPVVHIIPLTNNVVAADRFLYVPLAGLAFSAAIASDRIPSRLRRGLPWLMIAFLAASIVRIRQRNDDWANEFRFWIATIEQGPARNLVPRHELGRLLFLTGRRVEMVRLWGTFAFSTFDEKDSFMPDVRRLANEETAGAFASFGRYDATVMAIRGMASGARASDLAFAVALRAQSGAIESAWRLSQASPEIPSDINLTTIRGRLKKLVALGPVGPEGPLRFQRLLGTAAFGGPLADRSFLQLAADETAPPLIRLAATRWVLQTSPTEVGKRAVAGVAACPASEADRAEIAQALKKREDDDAMIRTFLSNMEADRAQRMTGR